MKYYMMPCTYEYDRERHQLLCYSNNGKKLLFQRDCNIIGEYPNDTAGVLYDPERLNVVEIDGKTVIITEIAASVPGRSHIRFWNAEGDSTGWYVNAGGSSFRHKGDINNDGKDEALFLCYNNRMNCASLLVLHPDSSYGCSPPYNDSGWDLTAVKPGNQLAYILFPYTDVGKAKSSLLWNSPSPAGIRVVNSKSININIAECRESSFYPADIEYNFDNRLRVIDIWFTDIFRKLRNDLLDQGANISKVDWNIYQKQVTEAVTYWTDSGWVSEGQLRTAEAKLK